MGHPGKKFQQNWDRSRSAKGRNRSKENVDQNDVFGVFGSVFPDRILELCRAKGKRNDEAHGLRHNMGDTPKVGWTMLVFKRDSRSSLRTRNEKGPKASFRACLGRLCKWCSGGSGDLTIELKVSGGQQVDSSWKGGN